MRRRRLITFDWAMKRLLRSKANFSILEGFLSELLKEEIQILEILESEGEKRHVQDKFNRMDLKVRDSRRDIILIEVQYERQQDYLQRILYGTSRIITEHLYETESYSEIVKVISISILFFDLGHGKDYVYQGTTTFKGIHKKDELQLTASQKALYHKEQICELYPEYYLIKVNQFDDHAKDPLDEWVYFLKHEEVKNEFQAKGLKEAKDKLDIMKLSDQERAAYESYVDDLHYQASMVHSSYGTGKLEGEKAGIKKGIKKGREEGIKKGIKEGREAIAVNLLKMGALSYEQIAQAALLPLSRIKELAKRK